MVNIKKCTLDALRLFLVFCAGTVSAQGTSELSNYVNHWVANTGSTRATHIQNYLSDMVYYNNTSGFFPQGGMLLTRAIWDEGGCGNCGYSLASGANIGRLDAGNLSANPAIELASHSDVAHYNSLTCQINNFWARASFIRTGYVGNIGDPPTGANAPTVTCSNGALIAAPTVTDPSALAFDNSGNLLVADNGPDQDIKIFAFSPFRLLRTFGDRGGVYGKANVGKTKTVSGTAGTRRFWGIRGLAVDPAGNLYVGNTGLVEQQNGGTNIRAFSHVDSSLMWETSGLAFVNGADVDPASGGNSIYIQGKRFTMDYTKAPGLSWKLSGVTMDPFRWPNDPRNSLGFGVSFIRRIQGKKFQFSMPMSATYMYVTRYVDSSEIGIPTAFFCLGQDFYPGGGLYAWGTDSAPNWVRGESTKRNRWYWIDRNGDGIMNQSEYGIWSNWNGYNAAVDVDELGNIWLGGTGPAITTFGGDGGVTEFVAGALTNKGVPTYDMNNIRRFDVPFTANTATAIRIKHVVANDVLFLAGTDNTYYPDTIYVYSNYSNVAKRSLTCKINLGYDLAGQTNVVLDGNSAPMTLPIAFTADNDFVYVTYLDNGRYSRRRGEVTVYNAHDCSTVGWMAPTAVTGYESGAVDMLNAITVSTQPNRYKLVMVEEDGSGKVMVYRWHY